jgi:hypothetical protein
MTASELQPQPDASVSVAAQTHEKSIDERIKHAELAKLEIETRLLHTPWWKQLDIVAKIILAIFAVAGGAYTFYLGIPQRKLELSNVKSELAAAQGDVQHAVAKKNEAESMRERASSELANLQQQLLSLQSKAAPNDRSNYDAVVKPRVFVQFAGDLERGLINEFVTALKSTNFSVPAPERIAGPNRTEVRFFLPADAPTAEQNKIKLQAEQVLSATKDFFASKDCPLKEPSVKWVKRDAPSPLEVWISHSCKPK